MPDGSTLKIFQDVGIAIGVIVSLLGLVWFFVRWIKVRDDRSEKSATETLIRLGAKLDNRDDDVKSAYEAHISDMRTVVANNTAAMQDLTRSLNARPCLVRPKTDRSWFEPKPTDEEK